MEKKKVILIAGPTAVGKSAIAIELAKRINGEIISADSMQVYRDMNIGTAKITKSEMQEVPHYLIDVLNPDDEFNVAIFQRMAQEAVDEIVEKGHIPIVVGGTAFYIQAFLYGIDFTQEDHDKAYRESLYAIGNKDDGKDLLYNMLLKEDPEYADIVHMNNMKRVVRALEYHHFTGKKFSEYNEEQKMQDAVYDFCYFALNDVREKLYEKINLRVDRMIEEGLEAEVRSLKEKGYQDNLVSMQGLGYKEMYAYLQGEYSFEEAVEIIKRDTRHFAKRQLTWLKKERDVMMLNKADFDYDVEKILNKMLLEIEEKNLI